MSSDDILWGAGAIGDAIGRTRAQTYHLLYGGHLKSVKKIGNQWVASREALLQELCCTHVASNGREPMETAENR